MPILKSGKLVFSAYEKKIAELHKQLEEEAKKLGKAVEAKDAALREVKDLGERKAGLIKKLSDLEKEIEFAHQRLENEIKMRTSFIDSAKQELRQWEGKLDFIKLKTEELTAKLEGLNKVFKEVNDFVSMGNQARMEYLEAKEKLTKTKAEEGKILRDVRAEKEELSIKQKELETYYDYIREFSGRLTYNLSKVREATEYLNKSLEERGVPLTYGLPPDKVTELPFF